MFCYSEICDGNHKECHLVKNMGSLTLDFNHFVTEDNIEKR